MTTRQQCAGVTRAGEPCKGWAVGGSAFCITHAPERAAQLAEARSRGGKARHGRTIGVTGMSEPVTLRSLADVLGLLERTANELAGLENSVSRARAVIGLCTAWATCYETSELERRLAALETRLNGGAA